MRAREVYLVLFASVLTILGIYADPVVVDEDTVEIDDEADREGRKLRGDSYTNINGQNVMIGCKTVRNIHGECRPFGECYPIFRLRDAQALNAGKRKDGNAEENRVYDELKTLYRGVSGPCTDALLNAISKALGTPVPKQTYVCCPTVQNSSEVHKPTKIFRPPRPMEATGYQNSNSQCGRVFVERGAENETEAESSLALAGPDDQDSDVQGRIVNGRPANRGEFPWAVALMLNGRQFCGGSLIDSQHILTAAHCVYFMNRGDVNRLRVMIGDHHIYSTGDGHHEIRGVTNVYYHRSFSMKTIYDDVSVMRLSSPVTFTRYIQPICLSSNTWNLDNTMASVAGWGQVSEKGAQSPVLRTVNVRVWNQRDCSRRYSGRAPAGISNGMVCAGGNGYDSCKGDSGGPLNTRRGSRAEQIGIVSWGIGCGTFPGVYTRVDAYLGWINKNRR